MINALRSLAVFAKAIEHGSFRAAARELRLSPSVVSHHISQLEQQLGVSLIYRSTRKISLTRDGERLIEAAEAMVAAAETGINAVLQSASTLSGELHVSAPAVLARSPLATKIAAFVKAHPNVHVTIDFSDERRDVMADGMDVAIRMGWLRDSALKARKLFDVERVLSASPDYLRGRPTPKSPADIADWDWLELTPVPLKPVFRHHTKKAVSLRPSPRVGVNSATAVLELTVQGVGLSILPQFLAEQAAREGAIELLLPEWTLPSVGVYAVRPNNAARTGLAAEFVTAISS